ncbi:hypothetical protein MNBD_ALPHA01-127 [hydrothermal vent metagenome]|uniref:Major facilitator superfamily (MFS) profile domain-containing protein n=1 Tax=hydrothermal vent metagenome TaxID=652676 RepID=A0A3B0RVY3_9ZZZZ
MSHPASWKNLLALGVVYSSGYVGAMSLPLWLGGIVTKFSVEEWIAGAIGGLYFFGVFLGSITLSSRIDGMNKRKAAIAGLCMACLGIAAVIFIENLLFIAVALTISGLGFGLGLAATTATVSKMDDVQKNFSIIHFILVIFAILFFSIVPAQMASYGLNAVFFAMAFTAFIAAITAFLLFPDTPQIQGDMAPADNRSEGKISITWLAYLALFAIAFFQIGQNGVWSFIERVGDVNGFDIQEIGHVLLAGAFINILGPLAAIWIGERFGIMIPIIVSVVVLCGASVLLFTVYIPAVFIIGAILVPLTGLFAVPYMLGYIAQVDHTGKASAMAPGFMMIGNGLGPALAGMTVSAGGLAMLGPAVFIPYGAAIMIYFLLGKGKH